MLSFGGLFFRGKNFFFVLSSPKRIDNLLSINHYRQHRGMTQFCSISVVNQLYTLGRGVTLK